MSDHPLSPPAWVLWLLAVLACVLFASTFEWLDGLTVALVIGLIAAGVLSCASLVIAPLLGMMDAWEEAKLAAASPPRPEESELPARARQFSLKQMFVWMVAGAIVWRLLSGSISETPSLILALGVMMGVALVVDGCAVAIDLSHNLVRRVLRRVACLLRPPTEDSR